MLKFIKNANQHERSNTFFWKFKIRETPKSSNPCSCLDKYKVPTVERNKRVPASIQTFERENSWFLFGN